MVGRVECILQGFHEQVEGDALFFLYLTESLYRLLVHPFPLFELVDQMGITNFG